MSLITDLIRFVFTLTMLALMLTAAGLVFADDSYASWKVEEGESIATSSWKVEEGESADTMQGPVLRLDKSSPKL